MIEDIELARLSVHTAQVVTWTAFSAVTLATVAGFAESISPGFLARMDARIARVVRWALRAALRAVYPVKRVSVTYLHTYRCDKATDRPEADGRHAAGFGRRTQPAGKHRWAAA